MNHNENQGSPKRHRKGCCMGGCLSTFVVLLALLGTAAFFAYRWVEKRVDLYESQGFTPERSQLIEIKEPIEKKMVYVGRQVRLRSDISTDVAIIAQQAEVYGNVQGTLHFTGQQLLIKGDAVIRGDLNVSFAQQVFLDGVVEGEITGNYGQLVDRDGNAQTGFPTKASKPFPLVGFTLHEVKETESPQTITKTFEGGELHLLKEPAMAKPLAKSVSVVASNDQPSVHISFAEDEELKEITTRLNGKRIALLANGEPLSTPIIREPISGGSVVISGNFTLQEAEALVAKLKGESP